MGMVRRKLFCGCAYPRNWNKPDYKPVFLSVEERNIHCCYCVLEAYKVNIKRYQRILNSNFPKAFVKLNEANFFEGGAGFCLCNKHLRQAGLIW